uniref:Equilibrative nucleoside transporter 1 n=1 Tax=Caenorhabditis tropicalis TaxID=1561998 RepID=A0A1I7UW88_9PELO
MSESNEENEVHSENVSRRESQRSDNPIFDSYVESGVGSLRSIGDEDDEKEEVRDAGNYVFLAFLMFGFGSLLPWNMFLNISFDYYTMFKLRAERGTATWYSTNFQNAMTISAQIPSLVFSVINIFIAIKGDLTRRMRICLIVVQIMVIVTIMFIYINTSQWIGLFFVVTLLTIVMLNAANGLFQNSMFGLASPFPFKYTNAVIIGQNFCGTAVTALAMLTKAASDDVQMRAMLFFALSSVAVITCFILLNILKKLNFYRKYGELKQSSMSTEGEERSSWTSIREAFSKSKIQFFNIFMLFFVTLALFPNICMYVTDGKPGEKYDFVVPSRNRFWYFREIGISENYFMDVTTFLNFNLFAFLGSLMANCVRFVSTCSIRAKPPLLLNSFWSAPAAAAVAESVARLFVNPLVRSSSFLPEKITLEAFLCIFFQPGPNTIWIPVVARFWFMFYFPSANYHPMGFQRAYPVLFSSTWIFVFNVSIFALTSGYLSSLIMMYAPRSHKDPKIQRMAGMIASFFLLFGIVAGLVFSWQIRLFITGYAN